MVTVLLHGQYVVRWPKLETPLPLGVGEAHLFPRLSTTRGRAERERKAGWSAMVERLRNQHPAKEV